QCMLLAVKEFYRETLKELNEDGSSYENSVSYHRLVTELFLYTYLILVRQGYTVPENVIKRIKRSTDYIGNYTKKSGLAPLIGDNDNGQLLPLVPHDYLNHSYLFKLGKLIFGNYKSDTITEAQFLNIISTNLNDTFERHVVFDTGLAIVDKGSARLYVNNGYFSFDKGKKIGELSGTHTHCDNLSFELCLGSDDIFVDPGCYVYTSDPYMRNLFRSAESHNTVTVDEKNLGDYSDASVFLLKQVLYNLSLSHNYTNTEEIVEGCFNFNNGQLSYTHNRIFELSDSTLKITDSIKAKGSHSANLYLIIHPNIRIEASPVGLILSSDTYRITLQVADSDGYLKKPTIERWYYSPSYGNLKKNNRLKYDLPFSETVKINTIIKWEKLK
uniref:heparinase II/III family protein n=1 Tax=Bacteroides caecimuris TaxID=1796613 RepID=UPI0026E546EE